MDIITILTIIIGYVYLIISILVAIVKISYTCVKQSIMPKLILYYLIKSTNSFIGITYGMLFLNKVEYFLIAPFIGVFLIELFTLLIIGGLQLHNSLLETKLKNKVVPKCKIVNRKNKIFKLQDKPRRLHRSQSVPQITDEYMLNYIGKQVRTNSISPYPDHIIQNFYQPNVPIRYMQPIRSNEPIRYIQPTRTNRPKKPEKEKKKKKKGKFGFISSISEYLEDMEIEDEDDDEEEEEEDEEEIELEDDEDGPLSLSTISDFING